MAEKERFDLSNGKALVLYYDNCAENPREWDNAATMICGHSRYKYGDIQAKEGTVEELAREILNVLREDKNSSYLSREARIRSDDEYLLLKHVLDNVPDDEEPDEGKIRKAIQKVAMLVPIYMYEHGGVALSTGSFSDPFDSGLLGFAFITNAKIHAEWGGGHYTHTPQGSQWVHGTGIINKKRLEKARACIESEVETYSEYLNGNVWGFRMLDRKGNETDSCWGFYGDEYCVVLEHLGKADVRRLRREHPYEFGRKKK